MLLHDLYDYGNAGAGTAPRNFVAMAIAPLSYAFETAPGSERMYATMNHELVHIVTLDQAAGSDALFRKTFQGKILETEDNPLTILYGYLSTPRRSSPRWYREGIAVFLETWMTGGQGRALGGYDEMVFRAMVADERPFYDHVGIEAEGTQVDFQVGVNAYLYGTRFMTYLALTYGPEKVVGWSARGKGSEAYFAEQFRTVFGLPLGKAWQDWIAFEREWQSDNLAAVRRKPVTPFRPLTAQAVGSVSRAHYDRAARSLFAAINFPGQVAYLARIDLDSGQIEMLKEVKGSTLFDICALAFDPSKKSSSTPPTRCGGATSARTTSGRAPRGRCSTMRGSATSPSTVPTGRCGASGTSTASLRSPAFHTPMTAGARCIPGRSDAICTTSTSRRIGATWSAPWRGSAGGSRSSGCPSTACSRAARSTRRFSILIAASRRTSPFQRTGNTSTAPLTTRAYRTSFGTFWMRGGWRS